jgi:membrane-bound inhibitor of C-type lysozyme
MRIRLGSGLVVLMSAVVLVDCYSLPSAPDSGVDGGRDTLPALDTEAADNEGWDARDSPGIDAPAQDTPALSLPDGREDSRGSRNDDVFAADLPDDGGSSSIDLAQDSSRAGRWLPCDQANALACDGQMSDQMLICNPNSRTWYPNGTCRDGEFCDQSSGKCLAVVPECSGKQPGEHVCISRTIHECGPDLVTAPLTDTCDAIVGDCARCRPLLLASGQSGLGAIAIAGGYVYWFSSNANNGGIFRASRNGGSTESVAPGHITLSMVTDGSYVYWFNRNQISSNGGVYRVAVAGGATTMVAADPGAGIIGRQDIAVDETYVYWTVQPPLAVKRALKQGGVAETFASSISGQVIGMAADRGTVYWQVDSGSIMQASASGGETSVLVAANAFSGLFVDGDYVYWSSASDGEIMRVRRSGGIPETIVTAQNRPFSIVADAAYVYWASLADGSVVKAPVAGGDLVVVDRGLGGAGWLASDNTSLCWTGMDLSGNNGTVMCLEE